MVGWPGATQDRLPAGSPCAVVPLEYRVEALTCRFCCGAWLVLEVSRDAFDVGLHDREVRARSRCSARAPRGVLGRGTAGSSSPEHCAAPPGQASEVRTCRPGVAGSAGPADPMGAGNCAILT